MKLEYSYYKITDTKETDGGTTYQIELIAGCKVYEGHFPGNPVSPGACNMQMIKELAEKTTGRPLHIAGIKQCRLMAVVSPQKSPLLTVTLSLTPSETGYTAVASIADDANIYLTFKGEMTA